MKNLNWVACGLLLTLELGMPTSPARAACILGFGSCTPTCVEVSEEQNYRFAVESAYRSLGSQGRLEFELVDRKSGKIQRKGALQLDCDLHTVFPAGSYSESEMLRGNDPLTNFTRVLLAAKRCEGDTVDVNGIKCKFKSIELNDVR